jgi:hypothetical protein
MVLRTQRPPVGAAYEFVCVPRHCSVCIPRMHTLPLQRMHTPQLQRMRTPPLQRMRNPQLQRMHAPQLHLLGIDAPYRAPGLGMDAWGLPRGSKRGERRGNAQA